MQIHMNTNTCAPVYTCWKPEESWWRPMVPSSGHEHSFSLCPHSGAVISAVDSQLLRSLGSYHSLCTRRTLAVPCRCWDLFPIQLWSRLQFLELGHDPTWPHMVSIGFMNNLSTVKCFWACNSQIHLKRWIIKNQWSFWQYREGIHCSLGAKHIFALHWWSCWTMSEAP